ncbi:uncharacterized protein KD926_011183 [Aspergillus affinis]|uniref:uncharacterized protein n=1 Tax=Aspergillus affinis TaxID=1070780 RepID=UPI0022FE1E1A|nr:uncharacterized protein KD926_011183 [Aspergillus affinis]KAI9038244.1 hypothetical protein KD926_011183 [Aspergillus affinis]
MPAELKSQLPTEVKTFLHDTYAPAFIAQMVGANSEYRKYLSNPDCEKIRYWWAGNDAKCLAKSKWYVALNKIASQCTVREHFKLDMEQSEAVALAEALLVEVKTKDRIKRFINGGHMATDVNKICSFFNALEPDKDLAKSWFDRILRLLQDETTHQVRGKQVKDELAKDHLYDTMKTFIELLLAQDSQFTGEVATKLVEDLRKFEENAINKNDTAKKQAENIMLKMAVLPQQIANLQAAAPITKKLSGTRLFQFASSVVDRVAENIPNGLKRIAKYFRLYVLERNP